MNKSITYQIDKNNCWNCNSHKIDSKGYPRIQINKKQTTIHRYFYKIFNGNCDNLVVRHTCDNKLCINPNHLVLGTHQDNVQDRVERNRNAIGENNGRSKLNAILVKTIKYQSQNKSKTELAKLYNVSSKVIYNIQNNLTWKHI